jgi:hypothetical protein
MTSVRKPAVGPNPVARIQGMKRSRDPLRRQCGLFLEGFGETLRTEGAFYLRFCTLAPMQVAALEALWGISGDPWRLFRRLCTFFRVSPAPSGARKKPDRACLPQRDLAEPSQSSLSSSSRCEKSGTTR